MTSIDLIIQEPIVKLGTSYIDGKIINDSDIFLNIGYDNYVMLNRKYPYFFEYFKECDTKLDNIGMIPGQISLITNGDANKIKSDIIKTIYYRKYISPNSYLVSDEKINIKTPTKSEDTTLIWIFICIVMLSLLTFSFYILMTSKYLNNYKNLQKIKF